MSRDWASLEIDRKARAYAPAQPVVKQAADVRLTHFDEI